MAIESYLKILDVLAIALVNLGKVIYGLAFKKYTN
jgi:hypothetical protein